MKNRLTAKELMLMIPEVKIKMAAKTIPSRLNEWTG
jgi:hypothetical protein